MKRTLRRLVAVGVLSLSACGDSNGDAGEATTLDEVLGTPTRDVKRGRVERYNQEASEIIAQCMIEEGFDFVAWVDPLLLMAPDPEEFAGLSDREIAVQYGFGLTTIRYIEPALDGNPNIPFYETLSDSDQAAYDLALAGEILDGEGGVTYTEVSGDRAGGSGCRQRAYDELTPEAAPSSDLVEQYHELRGDFEDRIQSDSRVLDSNATAEQCLGDAGFSPGPGASISPVSIFYDAAYEEFGDVYPDLVALEELVDEGEFDTEGLRRIQSLEREIARVSYDCLVPAFDQIELVRSELEPAFISDNYLLLVEVAPGL